MEYNQAKENYLRARKAYEEARIEHVRRVEAARNIQNRISIADNKAGQLKRQLAQELGSPDEEHLLNELNRAQTEASILRENIGDGGKVSQQELDLLIGPFRNDLSLTAMEFERVILTEELKQIPPETLEILKRAFSVCYTDQWDVFLEIAFPQSLTFQERNDLRKSVQAKHGWVF